MNNTEDVPPEPTGDEAALLAGIVAAPDDDLPRLVYADWLDEHERPDDAAVIRAEIEWARCSRLACEAGQRARELAPAKADYFRRLYGPAHQVVNSSRGLADTVDTCVEPFVKHGPRLFRIAPLTSAVLHRISGQVAALADCPILARLTDLQLINPWFHEDVKAAEFAPLYRSPHVGRLRRLRFSGCRPFNLRALFNSTRLGGLRVLYVDQGELLGLSRGGPLGDGLAGLTSLNLWGTGLRETDVQVLANSPALGRLEHLGLLGTTLTHAGVAAIANSQTLNNLRYLEIGTDDHSEEAVEVLRSRPELTVGHNYFNPSDDAPSWDDWPHASRHVAETVWAKQ